MTRTIVTYGAIAGGLAILGVIASLEVGRGLGMSGLQAVGYLIMLFALSVIFVCVKRHRDRARGGLIGFGPAFLLGLGVAGAAGLVYVAVWEMYLAITGHAFIHDYAAGVLEQKRAAGASEAELAETAAGLERMTAHYANPAMRAGITFLEIFPVGFLVALVTAGVLRRTKLPAAGDASQS